MYYKCGDFVVAEFLDSTYECQIVEVCKDQVLYQVVYLDDEEVLITRYIDIRKVNDDKTSLRFGEINGLNGPAVYYFEKFGQVYIYLNISGILYNINDVVGPHWSSNMNSWIKEKENLIKIIALSDDAKLESVFTCIKNSNLEEKDFVERIYRSPKLKRYTMEELEEFVGGPFELISSEEARGYKE